MPRLKKIKPGMGDVVRSRERVVKKRRVRRSKNRAKK